MNLIPKLLGGKTFRKPFDEPKKNVKIIFILIQLSELNRAAGDYEIMILTDNDFGASLKEIE